MAKRKQLILLSHDAIAVQAVIYPGEHLVSIRELSNRTFGNTSPVSLTRTLRAISILESDGRLVRDEELHGRVLSVKSLDNRNHGWQLQAIMHQLVASVEVVEAT